MAIIGLLGKKIGMTQIFRNNGDAVPVTVIKAGPCSITQIKTKEKEGYSAVQIGYENVHSKYINKCELGHLKKIKGPAVKHLKEFRIESCEKFTIGQELSVANFSIGEYINVHAKSIGKGFAGYQKRHRFTRGPMSHGSKNHRLPGSIGAGTTPGRVFPGKKMAGRMGNQQVTIKNLEILNIDAQNNTLVVKGSIPGKPGNLISITIS